MSSNTCIPTDSLAVIFIILPALIFWSLFFTFILTKFIPRIKTLLERLDKHGFIKEMLLAGVIVAILTIAVATFSILNLAFSAASRGRSELVPSSENYFQAFVPSSEWASSTTSVISRPIDFRNFENKIISTTEKESATMTVTIKEAPTLNVATTVEISASSVVENTSPSTSDIEGVKSTTAECKISTVQPPWYVSVSKGNVVSVVDKASVVQPPWYASGERSDAGHVAGKVSTMTSSTSSAMSSFVSSTAQKIIAEL